MSENTHPIDVTERAHLTSRLDERVAYLGQHGWTTVSRSRNQAQLVKGKDTSHLFHLVLSIITVGFWVPVWICVTVLGGRKTRTVTVTEHGSIIEK